MRYLGQSFDVPGLLGMLYRALCRDELCRLKVKDFEHDRLGVTHQPVSGTSGKIRYVPLHPTASALGLVYLKAVGHSAEDGGAPPPARQQPR